MDFDSAENGVMMWRVKWNRVNTFDRYKAWGWEEPDKCILCDEIEETLTHLFFECTPSQTLTQSLGWGTHRDWSTTTTTRKSKKLLVIIDGWRDYHGSSNVGVDMVSYFNNNLAYLEGQE